MSLPEEACRACGAGVLDIDVNCSSCGHALSSTGAQRLIGEKVLGQYEVLGILGQGGMSVVYRGKHAVTGQEVALKVLPPDLAAHRDVKSRFLEEGRVLAQLDHPNIVHLYNSGGDGDSLVLAMQFVRGKTWERVIMEKDSLSWQLSADFTCDVARALD
ncbi:MAG: protein kinase [Myxococcales bacterium]|nr:protein kinase [Myxococcales bacterium]